MKATAVGPYPVGTTVWLSHTGYTLKSVRVYDGSASEEDSATALPTGRVAVEALFEISGQGTNPAPGGGFFSSSIILVVGGKATSAGALSASWDGEAPPGTVPSERLAFEVPSDTRSLVLRVVPTNDSSSTVDFRLW